MRRNAAAYRCGLRTCEATPVRHHFEFPGGQDKEAVASSAASAEALIVREREAIRGRVEVSAETGGRQRDRLTVGCSRISPISSCHKLKRGKTCCYDRCFPLTPCSALPAANSFLKSIRRTSCGLRQAIAGTSVRGPCWPEMRTRGMRCFLLPSFCTTIRKSRRKATATFSTAPRLTKSWRCAFSPSATMRNADSARAPRTREAL